MLRNPVGGFLFVITLYLSAFLGAVFIQAPSFPLLLWRPSWFRWWNDRWIEIWLILPPALLEILCGTTVVVSGVKPPRDESAIIVMNHRCRLDWMFYWCYLHRFGRLRHEKIILKYDLKNIPGPGWAMQNVMFFFLKRRWEEDEGYMNRILNYFIDISYPLQLLIFPEGTDFCEESKAKSDSFARKNNLPTYDYCLHPRVRGFTFLVEKMRYKGLKAVHNVTVGYPRNVCHGELDLLRGNFPEEIHFHLERHPADSLPLDTRDLEDWCTKKWAEKEKQLETFYTGNQQFGPPTENSVGLENQAETSARRMMKAVIIWWFLFILVTGYGVLTSSIVWWYFLVVNVLYFIQCLVGGGTDRLQLLVHKWFNKKKDVE